MNAVEKRKIKGLIAKLDKLPISHIKDIEFQDSYIRYYKKDIHHGYGQVSMNVLFASDDVDGFPGCCAFDVLSGFPYDDGGDDTDDFYGPEPPHPTVYYELMTEWSKHVKFERCPLIALSGKQLKSVKALKKGGFKQILPEFKNPNSGNLIYLLSTKK